MSQIGILTTMKKTQVEVLNVNVPGAVSRVDGAKYSDMKAAMLKVLPESAPGFTHTEIKTSVKPLLNATLFPEGKTSGWWSKTVQLDMEARGELLRQDSKPLRWYLPENK